MKDFAEVLLYTIYESGLIGENCASCTCPID